ncbi:hypothetical protein ACG904_17650 [Acinetobacter guillouiae]|uniref:hypothetical protein n=1 Tax=Acinetobacter guillouiae TaxID=106649 RepID=UPI003AF62DF8
MSNSNQIKQTQFPLYTKDYRLEGYVTSRSEEVFKYNNSQRLSVSLSGIDLEKYLTYKKKVLNLGEYGLFAIYIQSTCSPKMAEIEYQKLIENGEVRDLNHLIELYNNSSLVI